MGIFGDKKIFSADFWPSYNGETKIEVQKLSGDSKKLLPFSCISIIGSQITVLSPQYSREFCKKLLSFSEFGETKYEDTSMISNTKIEMFERKKNIIYNQFSPIPSIAITSQNDGQFQTNTVNALIRYLSAIFSRCDSSTKIKLRSFVLMLSDFYVCELVPIINRINMLDIYGRSELAQTQVGFCSDLYLLWDEELTFLPGTQKFDEILIEVKQYCSG